MKVLITGASGLLGTDVWKVFSEKHDVLAMGRTRGPHIPLAQWREGDLRDARTTYTTVTKENPDLIVHCASYNDVDGAETHPQETFRVNAGGARNLGLACQRFDTVLLAVSTDYVFDGEGATESGYRIQIRSLPRRTRRNRRIQEMRDPVRKPGIAGPHAVGFRGTAWTTRRTAASGHAAIRPCRGPA